MPAVRSFTELLENADVAIFFYAGHGLQVAGRNYLIPVDAKLQNERDLDFDAVNLDFILKQMELGRADKTNIVFLDACRDNPFTRNLARSMGTRSASIGKGLAQVDTGVGTFIAYSTQPGNVALDGTGRNSPFTAALAKHVLEPDHNLTSVMIQVRKDVLAATGGKQVPWDHSALTGEFYFQQTAVPGQRSATGGGADSDVQQRMRSLEDEVKKKSDAEQTSNIVALAQARERLRQLQEANQADQQKIFDKQYETGSNGDARLPAKPFHGDRQDPDADGPPRRAAEEAARGDCDARGQARHPGAKGRRHREIARAGYPTSLRPRSLNRRRRFGFEVRQSVERRQHDQRQYRRRHDAADDDGGERPLNLGARANVERHGHEPQAGNKRRHQHGTQPGHRALDDGGLQLEPLPRAAAR